ncbi:MAG: hypothetical protein JXA30_21445 [Deltaproteobacteria bacterium]|nr:hypothetical protein [Deltaproteobacteria bacterium]
MNRGWLVAGLTLAFYGCESCGRDIPSRIRVAGPTPYVRCLAVDPPKDRRWKVGAATLSTRGRTLAIEGIDPPIRIVAFSGPAYVRSSIERQLREMSLKKPDLALLLGGVGDDKETASRSLRALGKMDFPTLVLAGGRDSWPFIKSAFSSLDPPARDRVINLTAMRSVQIGNSLFIPVAGSAEGRYALGENACGFNQIDLEQIADVLPEEDGDRRWLIAWEAPAVDKENSICRTSGGIDVGSPELGAFTKRVGAGSGLFAWPYVQVMRPYSSTRGSRIPFGIKTEDFHLVVPRLIGPAMDRDDGSYGRPGFAVLQIDEKGAVVESP